jgi:hypothetical protein
MAEVVREATRLQEKEKEEVKSRRRPRNLVNAPEEDRSGRRQSSKFS